MVSGSRRRAASDTGLDQESMMAQFTEDYLGLLNQRVLDIQTELHVGNVVTAEVAMLSLESTSRMVGANRLAGIVGRFRVALAQNDRAAFGHLAEALVAEARTVATELSPGRGVSSEKLVTTVVGTTRVTDPTRTQAVRPIASR